MNDPTTPAPRRALLAAALLVSVAAPAAAALSQDLGDSYEIALQQNVVYPVRGDRDHIVIDQAPSPRGGYSAFRLTVLSPIGNSTVYDVPAQPRTVLSLAPFDREPASGPWTLRDTLMGLGTFTAEVHITDRRGVDGAQRCDGGYSALGGHPQVFVHTIVWLENANACAVESVR